MTSENRIFHPPSELWRHKTCTKLTLPYKATPFLYGSPSQSLSEPTQVYKVKGDGNCFFRALSVAVTGCEENHGLLRSMIVSYIKSESSLVLGGIIQNMTRDQYLERSCMEVNGTYATEVEIFVASALLDAPIYVFSKFGTRYKWLEFKPSDTRKPVAHNSSTSVDALYLYHKSGDHYDLVVAVEGESYEQNSRVAYPGKHHVNIVPKKVPSKSSNNKKMEKKKGQEPSLTTWVFMIANCLQIFIEDVKYGKFLGFNRGYCASLLYSLFDHLEGKQYAVTNNLDFLFLPFAMRLTNIVQDVQLAQRIEDFHRNGKNQLLLSQSHYKRNDYYLDYFGVLKREEGLDCFMIAYRKTVPALYFPRLETDIRNIISVEELELEDKFEYLAEILEGTTMRTREAYLPVFAKNAYKREVQTKFANFVKEIKDSKVEREKEKEMIFGETYREDLTKRDLSDMMKVNIFAENFEEAWDCFQLSKDKLRSSSLEEKSVKLLLNQCIKLNDVEKVIEVLNNIADEEMWILDHCKQLVLDKVELSRDQRESISCL